MPTFDFSNKNNKPKIVPAYLLSDDEDEVDDNESINLNYYDILFMLPKKIRKEIIYKLELKEEFLEKKRQRNLEKYKYESNIKVFKMKNKDKLNKEL
jgi:hypothetical protein